MIKAVNNNNLLIKIFLGIIIGVVVGLLSIEIAQSLKLFADIFVKLIKMVVAPIIFFTIVLAILSHSNLKAAGIIGMKVIIYFEIVTTMALLLGLFFVNVIKPGAGINVHNIDHASIAQYTKYSIQANAANQAGIADHILNIIPNSVFGGFIEGNLLQVLFFSVLFGIALLSTEHKAKKSIKDILQPLSLVFFQILNILIKFAPFAVCGAIAYTISKFGLGLILNFAKVILTVYLSMFVFVFIILGTICSYYGINLLKILALIKDELLITFGTCSSEAVLPRVMEKLINNGHDKEVVSMVMPLGYSFNLDGTAIYLSIATIFIAQAYGIDLSWHQQLMIIGILMVTSKGSAAVAGGGFITLAATLSVSNILPIEGLALVIGIDRFLSEGRSLTNLIGNTVAVFIIEKATKHNHQVIDNKQLA